MSPLLVAAIAFACVLGGMLLGRRVRAALPGEHLSPESRDAVKVAMGLVATMTALVLGLVTASAKSSYDDVDTAAKQSATALLNLDRLLAQFGPETRPLRDEMGQVISGRVDAIWPPRQGR